MKANKLTLLLIGAVLVSLFTAPVIADPKEGLIADNKRKHIARDPLIEGSGTTSGWVTFACESLVGLESSVSVKGLLSSTTYTVRAESLSHVFLPWLGPPFWFSTADGVGFTYPLGTITTNGEGEGEVSSFVPLPPGMYGWEIKVADPDGIDVLWTIPSIPWVTPGDPVDFGVLPAWP